MALTFGTLLSSQRTNTHRPTARCGVRTGRPRQRTPARSARSTRAASEQRRPGASAGNACEPLNCATITGQAGTGEQQPTLPLASRSGDRGPEPPTGTPVGEDHSRPPLRSGGLGRSVFGGVLLSHTLAGAVPSALEGLASGFGMGPGVSPPLWPP